MDNCGPSVAWVKTNGIQAFQTRICDQDAYAVRILPTPSRQFPNNKWAMLIYLEKEPPHEGTMSNKPESRRMQRTPKNFQGTQVMNFPSESRSA